MEKEFSLMLMEHNVDVLSRTIYLLDDIEDDSVGSIVKGIRYLSMIGDDPINLHICSNGGEVSQMFHLYDMIQHSSVPIWTFGYGVVASAAVPILASGAQRFVSPHTRLMIHQIMTMPTPETGGIYVNENLSMAYEEKQVQKLFFQLLGKHSNQTASFYETKSIDKGQVWFGSKQALTWGLVDGEITSPTSRTCKRTTIQKKKTKDS